MTDWGVLLEKFKNFESGKSFPCKTHRTHYQDEIRNGCWFLHGHLIALYRPPFLLMSHCGWPTQLTRSRLAMIASSLIDGADVRRVSINKYCEKGLILQLDGKNYLIHRLLAVNVITREVFRVEGQELDMFANGAQVSSFLRPPVVVKTVFDTVPVLRSIRLQGIGVVKIFEDGVYLKPENYLVAFGLSADIFKRIMESIVKDGKHISKRAVKLFTLMEIIGDMDDMDGRLAVKLFDETF